MNINNDGSYSTFIKAGDYIFISGQVGFTDMDIGKEIEGIEGQTIHCLHKIESIMYSLGLSMTNLVKVTVFLRNMDDFPKMNEAYQSCFGEKKPARSTIVTDLVNPKMLVEIECIAYAAST
jgi:2-iminobutanoate/2-iminopropanoate deaminase